MTQLVADQHGLGFHNGAAIGKVADSDDLAHLISPRIPR
jgi:hypothetical protein